MALVIPSGSRTIMKMTTPPTGWTKDTTYNDYALRVTTGSVVNRTTGESFSTVFKNYNNISVPGPITYSAVNATTIDTTSLVSHRHLGINHPGSTITRRGGGSEIAVAAASAAPPTLTFSTAGSGASHTHPIGTVAVTGSINQGGVNSEINLNIKYVDTIIAVRS